MDMSAAALPPIQPRIPDEARAHPEYSAYLSYRSSCNRLMIEASRWEDWLHQRAENSRIDEWSRHARFPEFQRWMCPPLIEFVYDEGGAPGGQRFRRFKGRVEGCQDWIEVERVIL